jgi:hypothetical protein
MLGRAEPRGHGSQGGDLVRIKGRERHIQARDGWGMSPMYRTLEQYTAEELLVHYVAT